MTAAIILLANPGWATVCVQASAVNGATRATGIPRLFGKLAQAYVADRHANPRLASGARIKIQNLVNAAQPIIEALGFSLLRDRAAAHPPRRALLATRLGGRRRRTSGRAWSPSS